MLNKSNKQKKKMEKEELIKEITGWKKCHRLIIKGAIQQNAISPIVGILLEESLKILQEFLDGKTTADMRNELRQEGEQKHE